MVRVEVAFDSIFAMCKNLRASPIVWVVHVKLGILVVYRSQA
jgi:maleate cis-trans isomerase